MGFRNRKFGREISSTLVMDDCRSAGTARLHQKSVNHGGWARLRAGLG